MKRGVVYKFQKNNKINGTLFYCFEYFAFLNNKTKVRFYIVDISERDLNLVKKIFSEKYNFDEKIFGYITSIKATQLYQLNLDKTLVLDIKSFYGLKEFLTNDIHCFSNENHAGYKYKNERNITFYGCYDYQKYDIEAILKLNFDIFKKNGFEKKSGVFISSPNLKQLEKNTSKYRNLYKDKEIILKKHAVGRGDIFEVVDTIHYIHTGLDTNNRIIPEAFYYQKSVVIDEETNVQDSTGIRYNDITKNGIRKYQIKVSDAIIKAILDE